MIEKFVYIETPAGRMDLFVAHPPGMPCPAVVVFMDNWGLREELFDIARHVAAAGYYCVLPNTYFGVARFGSSIATRRARCARWKACRPGAKDCTRADARKAFAEDRG